MSDFTTPTPKGYLDTLLLCMSQTITMLHSIVEEKPDISGKDLIKTLDKGKKVFVLLQDIVKEE